MKEFFSPFRAEITPTGGKDRCRNVIGGRGEDMPLSEYVDSLDGVAKSRYFDKLKVLGLAASGDFQNAMQLWPPVEFGHIFCYRYLIERPGVYTRQELLQRKQARSVQLFQGWIRQDRGGVGSQKQQPVRYPERPGEPYHGPDESTLEIVVRFELLPLQQLLSCVNSWALDEVTENVAKLDRRPQSPGVLEVTRCVWVVCSS